MKHALSELALRATAEAPRARFAAWLAAYARVSVGGEARPYPQVRAEAERLGKPAGWPAAADDLSVLVRGGVLWRGSDRVALRLPYRPYWHYFSTQAERLYRAVRFLLDPPPASEPEGATYRGLVLLDFGLFFACHEHFEGLWRKAPSGDRAFYQGLVQLAAAFYHHEKGNAHGAAALLRRAVRQLEDYRPAHLGLDVDALLEELARWETRFAACGKAPYPVLVAARACGEAR